VAIANSTLSLDQVKIKLKLTTWKSIGLQGTFPCLRSGVTRLKCCVIISQLSHNPALSLNSGLIAYLQLDRELYSRSGL